MRRIREFRSRYQTVTVWKSPLATEFRVSGAIHACFHRKRFLTGLAWDLIAAAALLRPGEEPKSILMLGVAGGTALRTLRFLLPGVSLTGVDLDGELIDLAREEMDLDKTTARIIVDDAFRWMKENRRKFDIIIDDLYLAGEKDVFRADSCDASWADLLARSLAPGGILAVNLVIGAGHRKRQSTTRRHLIERFPSVRSLRTEESLNEVLIAGEETAKASALADYSKKFPDWRDRMFWNRITVRKLK